MQQTRSKECFVPNLFNRLTSRLPAWRAGALALLLVVLPLVLAQPPAAAQPGDPTAAIKAAVEQWLEGKYKIEEVRKTPVPGIYEVRIASDIIYVDEKAQHAFIDGNLIDIRNSRNLTRERTDELLTINFKDLPLNYAIKQVNGKGQRVLAVFEDPNCGYCKNMRRDLLKLDNTTVYTFTLPILAADSDVKARKAMCAADKVKAWNDLMFDGKVPGNSGNCDNPVAKVKELGAKLGVTATPTVFFINGKRLRGYVPPAELEKLLNENSKG
jgi:thiol:disulfide interchange protein DsbC